MPAITEDAGFSHNEYKQYAHKPRLFPKSYRDNRAVFHGSVTITDCNAFIDRIN